MRQFTRILVLILVPMLVGTLMYANCWAHGDECEVFGGVCSDDQPADGDSTFVGQPIPADDPSAASQYVLQGGQWPQPGGRGSPITLTYSFQNMFDGSMKGPDGVPLPNALVRTSIEQALGLWADVAPLNFIEVPDQGGPIPFGNYPDGQFGQIRFRHIFINGPDPPVGDPIAKAQAYFPFNSGNIAGDVEFDDGDPWQAIGTTHVPDILGAATHEIGHTLGLGHTPVEGAVMYWIFHRYDGPGTGFLTPVDVAGIQAIYGAGHGSVTPLAVPESATVVLLLPALALFQCRWRIRKCDKSA